VELSVEAGEEEDGRYRLTMSALISATMASVGKGAHWAKCQEPRSPYSPPGRIAPRL